MSKFLKYFLAVLLGSMVSALFFVLGLFMFIGILAASSGGEVKVADNSLLILDLNGPITERSSQDPFEQIIAELTGDVAPAGLNEVLAAIKKAGEDERIKGIYMESGLTMAATPPWKKSATPLSNSVLPENLFTVLPLCTPKKPTIWLLWPTRFT